MSSAPGSPTPVATAKSAAAAPGIPDYELVRIVGRGSYGDVWLARGVTGAWRAIKIVWRERFTNAEPFEREFRGLKEFADVSLGESSQMTLLHVGRNDAAGFFYYVMELADDAVNGRQIDPATYVPLTLAELRLRRGRIPADECARFGAELARSLASLHRRGLVHRDVKPSNVIFVAGVPKLADVGLVAPSASARTFVGTEGYVPPEGPGRPSADVFALAKVLYEISTGNDRQEFPKLPADLARLPDRAALLELNEIFLRACGPAPAERYRDGAAILDDLTALNAGASLRTRRFAGFVLRLAAAVVLVTALGVGGWYWQARLTAPPPPIAKGVLANSVAVLPFANGTGDPAQDYFCDAIGYEIAYALEGERDLLVTGSRAAFWGKNPELSKAEIAQGLRVAQWVEGSVQRSGTQIRLEARLTRGAEGVSREIGTFVRDVTEASALPDDVARAVAKKILQRVTLPTFAPPTKNPAAYDAFLRGRARQESIDPRNADAVKQTAGAAELYRNAVDLDPSFAVAWVRHADALRMGGQMPGGDKAWQDSAEAAVERALRLQPDLALAWAVRGFIRGVGRNDPDGLRDLARAEDLGGANAGTLMTRFLLAWFTSESHSLLPIARAAIARNPENIERIRVIPAALWYLGDYAEADRLYQRTGNFAARIQLRRDWRGTEAAVRLARQAPPSPETLCMHARMLGALGQTADAEKLLENVRPPPETWGVYLEAGLADRIRQHLEAELPKMQQMLARFAASGEPAGKDRVRLAVIRADIMLGHREEALALMGEWRLDLQRRKSNRRAGGDAMTDLPRFYARLGKHEDALALLTEFASYGRAFGYELRDTPEYAPLRDNPRFLELRRRAESWAERQPDPVDDPAAARK